VVFVDASEFHTSMTRKVPRSCGKNTTLISGISLEGAMGDSVAIEGATDAEAYEAYVEHFLAPTLKEGQVVLDELGAHRTDKVRELVEGRGADLMFLPSYSPDLNPIEEAFSKIKSIVRKVGAHTREALVEAIIRALVVVTPKRRQAGLPTPATSLRINLYEHRRRDHLCRLLYEPDYARFSDLGPCSRRGVRVGRRSTTPSAPR